MNSAIWTIALIISVLGVLLILNPTPNVAKAYSCSGSSSTHTGSVSSGISGTSGSCATSASSSSKTDSIGGGALIPPPPPNHNGASTNFPPNPGASITVQDGGGQSSCAAESASHVNVGNTNDGSVPGSISCSTHNP